MQKLRKLANVEKITGTEINPIIDRINVMSKILGRNIKGHLTSIGFWLETDGGSGGGDGGKRAKITDIDKSNGVIEVNLVNASNTVDGTALDVYIWRDKAVSAAFTPANWMPLLAESGQNAYVLVQQDQNNDWILVAPTLTSISDVVDAVIDELTPGNEDFCDLVKDCFEC